MPQVVVSLRSLMTLGNGIFEKLDEKVAASLSKWMT